MAKASKPRYTFARNPRGKRVVEEILPGLTISESVNRIVSLVKERPQELLPQEIAAVGEAVPGTPRRATSAST